MKIQLSDHFSYKKLIKFTLPTIIMMIFSSIYGVVDGLFISNYLGSDAFAGMNLIMPILIICASVGFMLGTGGSALVSKILGEDKKEEANKVFSMLTYLLIITGIIFSILGVIFMRPIASLLGAKGAVLNDCTTYGVVLVVTMVPYLLQNFFQSFLVVAEKPGMGLLVSIVAGVTNIVFDFLFIAVFKMGVFGAALATSMSQVVGGIIPLIYFICRNKSPLRLQKAKFKLKTILKTCANGSSEMLSNVSSSIITLLFNMQLMKFAGYDGVTAYGIIMYISFIFSGTYLGYSIGSAPIVSYHYGAGNTDELKNLFKKSLKLIISSSIVMIILAEIFARPLASIFVSYNEDLLRMTTTAIRIFSISYIMSGINTFASSFFTALNDGGASATISFFRTFIFQVATILILPIFFKINGIWFSVIVAEALALIVSFLFLIVKRKKYKYM